MANGAQDKLAIEIAGLGKSFGRTAVLRKLDLSVPWGEVLTILGPNGSGKTTLIKVLATLSKPDEGSIRLAGLDLGKLGRSIRRLIGVVTHDSLLYDELTGYENLKFYARMFSLDRAGERIATAAEKMGLEARLDQRAGTLSHGLRKRLSIARALLHDPLVLLMDEPESGLDQESLALLETVIREQARSRGTVLMTTHNLERGLALGHRLAILARGRIVHEESSLSAKGASSLREAYFRHTGTTP